METQFYIQPNLEILTVNEINTRPKLGNRKYVKALNYLLEKEFNVIIGEPGEGKSRLLKELVIRANEYDTQGIFIDLKSIGRENIAEKINSVSKTVVKPTDTNANINRIKDHFYSTNFDSSKEFFVCLDALDEVKRSNLDETIEKIRLFRNENPKTKIIVSCRNYIYRKSKNLFQEFEPNIFEVAPFTIYQVRNFLLNNDFSESEIEKVLDTFQNGMRVTTLTTPRILEIFVNIKIREGVENALKKSKSQLLDTFIYENLRSESEKTNRDLNEVIKRVLEKLALVMEVYQTNEITHDELMSFFDEINSNLSRLFFSQLTIDDFYDRYLLVGSKDGNHIQFQNAEFQEYLAAKEITRFTKIDQVTFDLTVDKQLREINPVWANTLKFIIELEPSLNILVTDFICNKSSTNNFSLLNSVILSDPHIIAGLDTSTKEQVFEKVFSTHNQFGLSLSAAIAEKMTWYCSESQAAEIRKSIESSQFDKNSVADNFHFMAHNLIANGKVVVDNLLVEKFCEIIKDSNQSDYIKRMSLKSLSHSNDIQILKELYASNIKGNNELRDQFLISARKIDPNDFLVIDLTIENMKADRLNSYSRDLNEITSPDSINYFLKSLLSQVEELQYSSFHIDSFKATEIVSNIEKAWNNDIRNSLVDLILSPEFDPRHDDFSHQLIFLLGKMEPKFLFDYLKLVIDSESKDWFKSNEIFLRLVNDNNVDTFLKSIESESSLREAIAWMILQNRASEISNRTTIMDTANKYLAPEMKKLEEQWQENEKRWDRSEKIYSKFKSQLEPANALFDGNIFHYYKQNKVLLEGKITESDLSKFRKIVTEHVLKFDFSNAHIKVTKETESSRRITTSNIIPVFGSALAVMSDLGINPNDHKAKLIEYFPFSFSYYQDKKINLLENLNSEDIEKIKLFYQTPRTDDLFVTNLENFFEFCEQYSIKSFSSILLEIVENEKYEAHDRKTSLRLFHSLSFDHKIIKQIFDKFIIGSETEISLAHLANEYLVSTINPQRMEAISWRLNWICDNPVKGDPNKLDPHDVEYRMSRFNKPLETIDDVRCVQLFINLIERAIMHYNSGKEYVSYAVYLWNLVFQYFDNLKIHKSYSPIHLLEAKINSFANSFAGYKLLKSSFNRIKLNYASTLGKPQSISYCVNMYNSLKDKNYSNINSPLDLQFLVADIIEVDLRRWIEKEGAYDLIRKAGRHEDLIQKTIKTQFENGLLKRGLRDTEVRITREEQLLSNKRTDFVISYGFIGQVLIELKLTSNPEVKDPKYCSKLIEYIEGTKSDYGIFLIFQIDEKNSWVKLESKVRTLYKDHEEKIKILGLNCVGENVKKLSSRKQKKSNKITSSKKKIVASQAKKKISK